MITLRPLEPCDLEFLAETRHHPETLPHLHDQRVFSLEQVQQWFAETHPAWLIVEADGARAGYVRLSEEDRNEHSLKIGMDIHPDHRRRGIAHSAYLELFRRLSDEGWRVVWLEVLAGNSAARTLYEKLGFTYDPTRVRMLESGGVRQESLTMIKPLID